MVCAIYTNYAAGQGLLLQYGQITLMTNSHLGFPNGEILALSCVHEAAVSLLPHLKPASS